MEGGAGGDGAEEAEGWVGVVKGQGECGWLQLLEGLLCVVAW